MAQSYRILGGTAREIAASAERLIRQGAYEPGDPLPTVRGLAAELPASPATVNAAYRILRERGLVVADGRRGTRVAPRPALTVPHAPAPAGTRDLSTGLPDPALLPALEPALRDLPLDARVRFSQLEADDPELMELARDWFAAEGIPATALSVVSGAFDGVDRVLGAHLRPGDRVIVEDPAYSFIRDLLLTRQITAVPVAVDDRGLVPEDFARALRAGADAVAIVPRAQNPLGAAMDAQRAAELRHLLEPHPDLLLIEDDHAGPVAGAPPTTLVGAGSRRWAVIRATSKFLHPDLRLGLLAGDEATVARVDGRRALGPRWVSHVLQALVARLLADPGLDELLATARATYAARRGALLAALAEHGIAAHGASGLNVWVPVREEAPVLRALLDHGYLAMAGERFRIQSPPGVRITISTLDLAAGEALRIAEVIASADGAAPGHLGY